MKPCYIFDIDGTIADNSHRTHHLQKQPKDWASYHKGVADDGPHKHIIGLANVLSSRAQIVLCTGRHEEQRPITTIWLYHNTGFVGPDESSARLYMRANGDHRPDHVVKAELLAKIKEDGFEPIMAFDDRNSVVEMWRANGVPCAQVADGNF